MMLISSVKAYEYGSISVPTLLTLTTIMYTSYEFLINKNKKDLFYKLVVSVIILVGVI